MQACATGPLYLVGGAIRDLLLNRSTADIDVACAESAKDLASRVAEKTGGTLVTLDDATKVYRVVIKKEACHLDIAQIQGRGIEEDLGRRDFTVNAMALHLNPDSQPDNGRGIFIDPRRGRQDLKRRIIRADDPKVFKDDPLRLLRAFRIAAQLNCSIDSTTLRHIRTNRGLITKPAGERVRQEMMSLLAVNPSHAWIKLMDASGLLTTLFAELEKARRCAEVYYGKGGVLKHTLIALERLDFLLAELERAFPDISADIKEHFKSLGSDFESQGPILRLGVLLHDIAKPATARKIGGRLRFFKHEEVGAKMAENILRKLRFSGQEVEQISAFIRHHLRPGNLAANAIVSDKAVFRFFHDLGRNAVGLTLVCWADHSSYLTMAQLRAILPHFCKDPHTFPIANLKDAAVRKTLRHIQVLHYLLKNYFTRRERVQPTKILDGNDVMKTLRIPPGPRVGKILDQLLEAQAAGKVLDRPSALRFIQKIRLGKNQAKSQ